MALDVERFEVHPSLILLLGSLQQLGDNLVHYVVDMSTTLQCAHVMSEREGEGEMPCYSLACICSV